MDFLIQDKSFDLSLMKCCDELENISNKFVIECYQVNDIDDKNIFIEASFDEFKQKFSDVIRKIIESIRKFFFDIRIKLSIKIQQLQLNKKLEELKDLLAKKRSKLVNKKYNYFDIKKYKQFYTQFINSYTAELKKGLNKDFKSVEEYEAWQTYMMNKLSEFNYKLTDDEQWRISTAINSAVELTDEEFKNREKNLKMIEEDGTKKIKDIEKCYINMGTKNSVVNYNKNSMIIFRLKNSFIGRICSKLAQAMQTLIKFVTKHIVGCILGLLAIIIIKV